MVLKFITTGKEFKMAIKKNKSRIKNNIRRLRFDANELTQQELADAAGVSRQTIVAIENEKYSPSLELAFRIAHYFNKPLEEVFSFQPEPEK